MKRIKIPLLYILSFALSVCPVGIYFLMNMERYVRTAPEGVKLTCGVVLLLSITLLKTMDRLKVPSRTTLFIIVFTLCYLLSSVLNDLIIFSFLALVGEVADSVCQIFIRRAKAEKNAVLTAKITASEIEKAVSGRV